MKIIFREKLTFTTTCPNSLKLFLLKKLILKNRKILIKNVDLSSNKNVILKSPFHYKTVKKHINIPIINYEVYTLTKRKKSRQCISVIELMQNCIIKL